MNGKRLERAALAFCGGALLGSLSSCNPETGPTLVVDVPKATMFLESTIGNGRLCCCRAIATATNKSTVPVHVTFRFEAYRKGQVEPIGSALDFFRDFQPGERRRVEAEGFILPCFAIDTFELVDINIKGLWYPPPD